MGAGPGCGDRGSLIQAARGSAPADILYTDAEVFNPFTGEWKETGFGVKDGIVIGPEVRRACRQVSLGGRRVVPGLIDAHVHIESSLLSPPEYARVVSGHGTTTVIADPHEIANVCGADGIAFMLGWRGRIPVDLFIMLPSCVPATPLDSGGAVLSPGDLARFAGHDGVLGLGEVMNVPGVLSEDPSVMEKVRMFPIVDGHAPLLTGNDLNAYLVAGIQSDHESSSSSEAQEKLEKGMFLSIREGSTEKNIRAIVPVVTWKTVSRCSFATDDRHADTLVREGHIDDCIRKAVLSGLDLELAIRMATLSAAERFSLNDRGALAPGRRADFCVLGRGPEFRVTDTYRAGERVVYDVPIACPPMDGRFSGWIPAPSDLHVEGHGDATVIGLIPHQILTRRLSFSLASGELPDLGRDILKVVVCSRYRRGKVGTGLVHGFGIHSGAIAGSISHDSHNIIAAGSGDADILRAMALVIRNRGGLAAVSGMNETLLPLTCAGLMSTRPYPEVSESLGDLNRHTSEIGGVEESFMYLSFLALTVIPSLRITERGLFDVDGWRDIPLFPEDPA